MQTCWTIEQMFPNANSSNYEVMVYSDETWEITKWDLPDQKPIKEEIEAYWNANQQAILDANKPAASEVDLLKKQVADLSFQLMLNGVL